MNSGLKNRLIHWVKSIDLILLSSFAGLAMLGILMVYSSSTYISVQYFDNPHHFFHRQLLWLIIGIVPFLFGLIFPIKLFKRFDKILVLVTIFLLLLVLIPGLGVERNYSTRWIGIGPLLFQPSEIAKVTMIFYFASVYAKKQKYIDQFLKGIMPPLVLLFFVFCLILLQPDLGTATSILLVCSLMLFCSGAKLKHLLLLGSAVGATIVLFAFSEEYRIRRVVSFLDPFDDPQGSGYQLINSYFAIHSGGLTGKGLGMSYQKYGYLPEAHTDFIMAVIAEELGMIGILAVIIFFALILWRGMIITLSLKDPFQKLLTIGLTFQLTIQAIVNLGAVSGMLPITGITLPFVSYGGSSLLVSMLIAGLLLQLGIASKNSRNRAMA
ncbi:putative lipid II flippase FtsW [Bacillus lacus]|uniref:Probable peptidoglycan glycosyltransferase FtsW n=1 Tax=Metabacillus lacus TaxID=1983721 RepID=A0A7X2J0C2_9BACI|nr:putative lipid II flippase FtsW [Metabacillus lacus]MRX72924.1 putative lipid II flippase FtsW [Metabacillus lacus]